MRTDIDWPSHLSYEPESGIITWTDGPRCGSIAGSRNTHGHVRIRRQGVSIYAHNIAWYALTGSWPTHEIDHINGDASDNRASNLREATHQQNMLNRGTYKNNTSGHKGVSLHRQSGRWRVRIKAGENYKHIGMFDDLASASAAYANAASVHHREFRRE